jgi:hypothetical protein
MTSSRASVLAALLAAPTLLDCSLMNLDDFREQRCHDDADCVPAQTAFGDAGRCDSYVCQQGSCVAQHGAEACNGKDDDCNGLIDDGVAVKPHELNGTSSPGAVMAYAVVPSAGATAFVVGGGGGRGTQVAAHGIVVRGAVSGPSARLEYASAALDPGDELQRCPVRTASAGVAASSCGFNEVALGADEEQLVYATISADGCARGQLRVGLAATSEPFRVWLGSTPAGKAPSSNIEVGVDVGPASGRCSGNSLLDQDGAAAGARSPAVAVLDVSPGGAGALVTWLAADFAAPVAPCSAAVDVPVQALGVMVPEAARNVAQRWLVGSDDGSPLSIGRASSLQPPSVVGLGEKGNGRYLVAFPAKKDGEDGIALVFVTLDSPHLSFVEAEFIVDDQPDLATLARGSSDDELALAWRSGCGATSTLKLSFLTAAGSSLDWSPPRSLAVGNVVSKPQILHASDGFTTQGNRGGLYVSWSEEPQRNVSRTRLARLPEAASQRAPEVFTVTSGALGLPLLFPGEDGMVNQGLVTVTGTDRPIVRVFPAWCQ